MMTRLSDLTIKERRHWELHLKATLEDTPALSKEIEGFLKGGELPNLEHPSDIHDWLEQPDRRVEIEDWND